MPAEWSGYGPPWHSATTEVSVVGDDGWIAAARGASEAMLELTICPGPVRSRVALSGELDAASAPRLGQALDQLCRDSSGEIVLDLAELRLVGAAGVTVFLRVDHQLRAVGGRLVLHRPGRQVWRVLAITGLDTVLTIQPVTSRSLSHAAANEIGQVS